MNLSRKISLFLIPRLCSLYIRFVAFTSSVVLEGEAHPDALREKKQAFIYAFWHGHQFFLSYLGVLRKQDDFRVLISQSNDGEFIARTIRCFGMESIRGSSSRGGAKAMIQMIRALREGKTVAVTPDGPRGPAGSVQPGIVRVAQKTDSPIIPLSCSSTRKKIFRSWDSFLLPLPFSKIVITFGKPLSILEEESLDSATSKIKQALSL